MSKTLVASRIRCWLVALVTVGGAACAADSFAAAGLRAGAAAVDITPVKLPVVVNGGFLTRSADKVHSRLFARAVVLGDGKTKLAICVVDSCGLVRPLLDEAKAEAEKRSGIPPQRMLISATHAHSAPSCWAALGTDMDPNYPAFLKPRLVEAIARAANNLVPARAGWAVVDAGKYTAVRRWIRRPDRMQVDPFGNRTVRANMHPGHRSLDAIGPSGPEDPDLSVVAFQDQAGRPIALLANFANHYVGAPAVSADYFGLFADGVAKRLAPAEGRERPPFVAMMSQGTSGDVWLRDYLEPKPAERRPDIRVYTDGVIDLAMQAYGKMRFRGDLELAMAETELPLRKRVPTARRLAWARRVVEEMGDRPPKNKTEVYAREAILLHENPGAVLKLQAIRIGDLGLTAIPNEVYALTGLKLKALSPLPTTINIELANGSQGYIPPPEQHPLGGYNTWPARSAGLEEQAEPKIVESVLRLLEQVADRPRRGNDRPLGPAAGSILAAEPLAYWRMDEMNGPRAVDAAGSRDGIYETGVVYYLQGPHGSRFGGRGTVNRAAHFAGGRMRAVIPGLGSRYSVEMWVWNGMPSDARAVTGYLFSRGRDQDTEAAGDHLGIAGTHLPDSAGKLLFFNGNRADDLLIGRTAIERWAWSHVVLVRDGAEVSVYLNGDPEPEVKGKIKWTVGPDVGQIFIGGRNDNFANFEGRLDEVAIYGRSLTPVEVAARFRVATGESPTSR